MQNFDEFLAYLVDVIDDLKFLWEFTSNNKVRNFSENSTKLFQNLANTLLRFHICGKFAGDMLSQVYVDFNNLSLCYDCPPRSLNSLRPLTLGIETEIRHFRRLVAPLIMKTIPDYPTKLTGSFSLFFPNIFLDNPNGVRRYYMFQLKHPVFFYSKSNFSFLHLLHEWKDVQHKIFIEWMQVDKNEYRTGSLFDWTNRVPRKPRAFRKVLNFNSSLKLYESGYPTSFIDYGSRLI
jgi:hypothetical protein